LLNAVTQSWEKIQSGKGSFKHNFRMVTNLLLDAGDLSEVTKKINEYFSTIKLGTPSSWETNYTMYIFSKDKFKYESNSLDGTHKIHNMVSFNGSEMKELLITTSFHDSIKAYKDSVGIISRQYIGDPAECDPFSFPLKELISSFRALKEKRISITPYKYKQNEKDSINYPAFLKSYVKATLITEDNTGHSITKDNTEHSIIGPREEIMKMISVDQSIKISSIKKENFEGKKYLVVTFKRSGSKEKFYIDPDRDYRVFYIIDEYNSKDSKSKEITKIEYQDINGILFPKYIVCYYIEDGIVTHLRELTFNNDWQLNIKTNDEDFEIVFPEGIRVINQENKNFIIDDNIKNSLKKPSGRSNLEGFFTWIIPKCADSFQAVRRERKASGGIFLCIDPATRGSVRWYQSLSNR
jgi:hypothetical protein